ncbi:MAG: hypothetical protein ACYTAN_18920 [Planctomycetota bacterium]|jgi:hypothetical protein
MSIYVRLDFEVRVDLAEGDGPTVEINEETDAERHRRAVEAAVSWIQQSGEIYLDGEDKDPARIFCDISDSDVEEVRVE